MNTVEQGYDAMPQNEWRRLERHRVEYGVTMRAFEEYLPPAPATVADIGGSVGRYSIDLARRGYEVTLVDLSGKCLEFARCKADEAGVHLADIIHADARNLTMLADASFDAVLLMGPLYHLLEHEQRVLAVREAHRIVRPGGRIFATFVSRTSTIQCAAGRSPEYIEKFAAAVEAVLTTGILRDPVASEGWPEAWLSHPAEVPPLMAEGGFEQVALMNLEALVYELEEKINAACEELHRRWIDLVYRLGRDPSVLGGGGHLLYVGEKR